MAAVFALASYAGDPGSGAPTAEVRQQFVDAFYRGNFRFDHLFTTPNDVRPFGGTGFFQEFTQTISTKRAAIVYGDPVAGTSVRAFQVLADVYAHYTGQAGGVTAVGFPVADGGYFPVFGTSNRAGEWGRFSKTTALFAWITTPDPQTGTLAFTVRDPYYSRWVLLGELSAIGAPITAETTVTSPRGGAAAVQRFERASMHYFTAGLLTGRLFSVSGPIWTVWRDAGGEAGFLGHPVSDETALSDGRRQQSFEGGTLVYRPGETAVIRPRVVRVTINAANPLRLNTGERLTVRGQLELVTAEIVSDRPVTFTVSASRVATLSSDGSSTATITGASAGSAVLTATSEGVVSTPITIIVAGTCCRVGEGAPDVVSQAMQAALLRNQLSVRQPLAAPARRTQSGWTQEALLADGRTRIVLTKADSLASAFLLSGDLLPIWEASPLAIGFPISDATARGRQNFESMTLAGRPVRSVAGDILARWALAGYETGALGDPATAASSVLSFNATQGTAQTFRNGLITSARGRALVTAGRIATRYQELGGPAGQLGFPLGEEILDAGRRRQTFEGGVLSYADASSDVQLDLSARRPQITTTPAIVAPGNRVRIALGGFEAGAQIRVSFPAATDGAPFLVTVPNGSFAWDVNVPASAATAVVTIQATDTRRPTAVAQGSYSIRALTDARVEKTSGDTQTGAPGSALPQPLTITVTDSAGNRLARQAVRWEASPGAVVSGAAFTDEFGQASATLRLPNAEGVALANATVAGRLVTFGARSAARSLTNFPRFTQSVDGTIGRTTATIRDKGAMLAAVASLVRYRQNAGQAGSGQGMADVALLNDYLRSFCVADTASGAVCDGYLLASANEPYVNLWRLAAFTGGGIEVVAERPEVGRIRDLSGADEPVLVALALTRNAQPAGVHFVVAIGATANAEVAIHDPNPVLGRQTLDAYLAGFVDSTGRQVRATIAAAIRLAARPATSGGFLVSGSRAFEVATPAGACPVALSWPGDAAPFSMVWCDGTQPAHQLDVAGTTGVVNVTSLDEPGAISALSPAAAATFRVTRPGLTWLATAQELTVSAETVVNGATFRSGVAPGGFFSVFGAGLAGSTVEIAGRGARVFFNGPFQINAVVPPETPVGTQPIRIRNTLGETTVFVEVGRSAPGIFVLSDGGGAATNQDSSLNRPANPVRRGQAVVIYATGLGAVERRGGLDVAVEPVQAILSDRTLSPFFSGLTPGFVGLYQVNLLIPSDFPPSLRHPLRLRQAGLESNEVEVAVQ